MDKIIQAFCWMLFHSLWQGVLLAVAACLFMLMPGKRSAAVRYNFFLVLMAVFVVVTGCTFFLQFSNAASVGANLDQQFATLFNRAIPYVFIGWLLIFLLKARQLFSQFKLIRHIRQNAQPFVDIRLKTMAHALGISRPVRLAESALIKMPVLIGHLKPVILFPAGFVNHLTPQQVEFILIHELAHIKRKDYLVNIFQEILEAIFFFNPALLWLSNLLRAERENCCDDIVLQHSTQKSLYISTLINSYEFSAGNLQLGLHYSHSVLSRVERMVEGKNKFPGRSTLLFLSLGLVVSLSFFPLENKASHHYHASGRICSDSKCTITTPPTQSVIPHKLHKDPLINNIIHSMLAERIISNADNISFALTRQKLIVNGAEQASCLAKILQEDYLDKSGLKEIAYNYPK